MDPTTFRTCTVADMEGAPNLAELFAEYAQESALEDLGEPIVQVETYRQMEAAGVLHMIGAFQGPHLVGFLVLIVSVVPHFGRLIASTESLFISKPARRGGAGMRLLQLAEEVATECGAVGLFVSAPVGSRLEGVMGGKKAYRNTNSLFFRSLT
ncbi:GNAT family N-acetyltransferase [Alcaligenaceae bacterium]|nr:GNAT family N-acetyltransferase [Alcaligenaceae bacterium]